MEQRLPESDFLKNKQDPPNLGMFGGSCVLWGEKKSENEMGVFSGFDLADQVDHLHGA